jgi:hypothetical protein
VRRLLRGDPDERYQTLRGAEKALERALLNANIRTIREKHVFDGATPLQI